MANPIESRSIKVEAVVQEKRQNEYGTANVGSMSFVVSFPASELAIVEVFRQQMLSMLQGIDIIRGRLVVEAEPVLIAGEGREVPTDSIGF